METEERRQDLWFVNVTDQDRRAVASNRYRAVIDLPRPMTAFEAADYAVRIAVRSILKGGAVGDGHTVTADVMWRSASSAGARRRACEAVAVYDAGWDAFMRLEPWRGDGCRAEVGATEGAVLLKI